MLEHPECSIVVYETISYMLLLSEIWVHPFDHYQPVEQPEFVHLYYL